MGSNDRSDFIGLCTVTFVMFLLADAEIKERRENVLRWNLEKGFHSLQTTHLDEKTK